MKHKFKTEKILITIVTIILLISGCSNINLGEESSDETGSTNEIYILEDISTVKSVEITYPENIKLVYENEKWKTNKIEETDQKAINALLNEFFSITGTPVESKSIIDEDIERIFSFTINDGESINRSFSFLKFNNQDYLVNETNDIYYKIENTPLGIERFTLSSLKLPIPLAVDEIKEIQIVQNEQPDIILNQETTMNEIETTPFVSGWFLHGPFETEFSVEYQKIQNFLEISQNLKGTKVTNETPEVQQNNELLRLIVNDGANKDTLFVNKNNTNEKSYNVYIDSHDSVFEIPVHLINQFMFDPISIVDNFITIIPVDAIQEITIKSSKFKDIIITANHDSSNSENNTQNFFINSKEINQEIFRQNYQYLAMIPYERSIQLDNDNIETNPDEIIKIIYNYGKDEENYRTEILMQSIKNTNEYLVTKDGITEFTTNQEDIAKIFDVLIKLSEE